MSPFVGIVYVKPVPIDVNMWHERLGGRIVDGKLSIWGLEISPDGEIKIKKASKKVINSKLQKLLKQTTSLCQIRFIGFGTYNSDNKLQVFFPIITDMLDFIKRLTLNVLLGLGLSPESAIQQAEIISNELLCNIIRKEKLVNRNMVTLGLRDFKEINGTMLVDEELERKIVKEYIKLVKTSKLSTDPKYDHLKRLFEKLKPDEIGYGLTAAIIVEIIVRLGSFIVQSMHCERGTCDIPHEINSRLQCDSISSKRMSIEMQTIEPYAVMVLNALELMDIVNVSDEASRTFKKTGQKELPCVVGATNFTRGENLIESTVFRESIHNNIHFGKPWVFERDKFSIFDKFL